MDYSRQGQKGQGRGGPARSSTVSGSSYRSTPGSTPPNQPRQSFGHDRVDGDGDAKDFRRATSSASHRAEGARANFGSLFRASRKKAGGGSGELTPPPLSASPGGARRGSHDSFRSSDRGSDARSIGSTTHGAGGSIRSFVGGISRKLKQTFRHPDYFQDEGMWDGAQWSPAGSATAAPHDDLAYHHYNGVSERDGQTLPLPPTTPQSRSHNSSDRTLVPLNDDEAIPADKLFSVLYDTPHSKAGVAAGRQGFDLHPIPTAVPPANQPVPLIYVGPMSPVLPQGQPVPDLVSESCTTMPTLPRSSSRPHKRPEKEQLSVISPVSSSFSFTTSPVSPNYDDHSGSATPPIPFEPISAGPFTGPPILPLPPPHDASFNLFNTEPAEKTSDQGDDKLVDKLVSSRTSSAPSAPDMHADTQTPSFSTAPRTPTSFATLGRSMSVRSPKSTAAIQQVVQANVAQSAARAGGNVASASHLFWVPAHVSAVDEGIVGGDFKAWVGAAKAGRVASLPPGELSVEDVTSTSQFFDTDAKPSTDDASPSRRTTLSRTSSISRSKSFKDRHVVITPDNVDEILRDLPGDVATGNGPTVAPHPAVAGLIASEFRDELIPRGTGKLSPRGSLRRPSPIRPKVTESPTDSSSPVFLRSESAPPPETKALPDLPSTPVAPLRSSSLARPRANGSPIPSGPGLGLAATLMRQGSLIQLPAPSDPVALDVALDEALTQIKKDPASAVVLPPPEIDDEEARAVVYAAMEAIEAAAWVDATIIGSDSELAAGEPGLASSEGAATMRRRKRRAVVGVGEGDGDEPQDRPAGRSSEDGGPAASELSRSWGSRTSSELFSRNAQMAGPPPSSQSITPATGARASTPPRPPPVPLPGRPVLDAPEESDSESVYSDGSSVASGRASEETGVFDPFADLRDLQASGGRRPASSGLESVTELTPVIAIPSRTAPAAATIAPQASQELEAPPSPSVRRPNKRASIRSMQSPSPSSGEDHPAEPSSARPLSSSASSSSSWSWLAGWMPGGSSVKTKKGGSVASTDDGPTAAMSTSPPPQGDASRPRSAAVGKRSKLFGGGAGGDAAAASEARSETRRRPASRSSDDYDDGDRPLDGFPRFPLQVEKSIYRMSHVKLAQDRRPLMEQVEISNLMLFILSVHADVTLNRQGPRGRKKKKGKRSRKKGAQAQPTAPTGGSGAATAPVDDNVVEFSKTPGRSSRPAMPSAPLVDLSQPSTFGLDTGGGGGLRPQQLVPPQGLLPAPAPSPISPAPPLLLAPPPPQIPPGSVSMPIRLPPVLPPGAILGPPPPMAFFGGAPVPGPGGPIAGVAPAGGPPRMGMPGPPPPGLLMRGRPAPPPAGILGIPGMPPVLLQPGLGAGPVPPPPPLALRGPVSPPAGYPLSPHLPDVALPSEMDSDTGPAAPRGGGGRNMDLFLAVMGEDADSDSGGDGRRPQRTSSDSGRKILPIGGGGSGGGGGGRAAGKRASSRAGGTGRAFGAGSTAAARSVSGGGGGGGGGADEDDVPLGMLQTTRTR
ncbi:hypothetical protein HK405_012811 [Cladochytrium tenue]|nr:hypothetical protein HK405_012811 [Cladochytrium tenue]